MSFKEFPLAITFSSYHYRKLWDDCKYRIADGYFKDHKEEITAINRFKRLKSRIDMLNMKEHIDRHGKIERLIQM
jgi:hypothetical protein